MEYNKEWNVSPSWSLGHSYRKRENHYGSTCVQDWCGRGQSSCHIQYWWLRSQQISQNIKVQSAPHCCPITYSPLTNLECNLRQDFGKPKKGWASYIWWTVHYWFALPMDCLPVIWHWRQRQRGSPSIFLVNWCIKHGPSHRWTEKKLCSLGATKALSWSWQSVMHSQESIRISTAAWVTE